MESQGDRMGSALALPWLQRHLLSSGCHQGSLWPPESPSFLQAQACTAPSPGL